MVYKEVLYVLSVSLQISGAFLLAYMGFVKKTKNIAEEVMGFVLRGKDIDSIPIPQVAGKLLEIYLTRIGFCLVLVGYILSIFGSQMILNLMNYLYLIIYLSIILITISLIFSYKLMAYRKPKIENKIKNDLPFGALFLKEID